jgi:hypothetical protein
VSLSHEPWFDFNQEFENIWRGPVDQNLVYFKINFLSHISRQPIGHFHSCNFEQLYTPTLLPTSQQNIGQKLIFSGRERQRHVLLQFVPHPKKIPIM